jgi:hypothetical protein
MQTCFLNLYKSNLIYLNKKHFILYFKMFINLISIFLLTGIWPLKHHRCYAQFNNRTAI